MLETIRITHTMAFQSIKDEKSFKEDSRQSQDNESKNVGAAQINFISHISQT
jgi:hypothetical protein